MTYLEGVTRFNQKAASDLALYGERNGLIDSRAKEIKIDGKPVAVLFLHLPGKALASIFDSLWDGGLHDRLSKLIDLSRENLVEIIADAAFLVGAHIPFDSKNVHAGGFIALAAVHILSHREPDGGSIIENAFHFGTDRDVNDHLWSHGVGMDEVLKREDLRD